MNLHDLKHIFAKYETSLSLFHPSNPLAWQCHTFFDDFLSGYKRNELGELGMKGKNLEITNLFYCKALVPSPVPQDQIPKKS